MGVQPHVARHRFVVVAVLGDEGDEELGLAHRHRLDCDLSWWHLERGVGVWWGCGRGGGGGGRCLGRRGDWGFGQTSARGG